MNRRIDKYRRLLKKSGEDAGLVTNFSNVTYLTGFTGDDSYLLVTRSDQILISDMRYEQQLQEECPGLDLEIRRPGVKMVDAVGKLVGAAKIGNLAVEAGSMTLSLYAAIDKKLAKVDLSPQEDLVEHLRLIKDKDEVARLRTAVRHAEKAFAVTKASLRGDQTELEVAHAIENQIRLFGGQGCSFPPIVAAGPRAALPHAAATTRRIGESDFTLVDWGACSEQYRSDLTRILVTGRISPKLERIYGLVLKAQRQAIAAIRPGAIMSSVDAAARKVITRGGYGKQFGHGLGHGIGLDIHELPRLAVDQNGPLKAGMVVTVEPGIYLIGWGGIRIEDDVLVTRDGHEVLTSVGKELTDCIVA